MSDEFVEDILAEAIPIEVPPKEGDSPKDPGAPKTEELTNDSQGSKTNEPAPIEETIESVATKLGWNPTHKGEGYLDAVSYILKSREIQTTMKEHNRDLKNQLTNVQGAVESLKDHNERVYRAEVKKMQSEIDSLKKERRTAIETADVNKVEELDQKIEGLQKDIKEPPPKVATSNNVVFDDWIKDNQWYLVDEEMAAYAESVAQQYVKSPLKPDRIYQIVRKEVEKVFPDKFETNKKDTSTKLDDTTNLQNLSTDGKKVIGPANAVEGARKASSPKTIFTENNLTTDQIAIMNQFIKSGVMTKDQYISDIAKMREE